MLQKAQGTQTNLAGHGNRVQVNSECDFGDGGSTKMAVPGDKQDSERVSMRSASVVFLLLPGVCLCSNERKDTSEVQKFVQAGVEGRNCCGRPGCRMRGRASQVFAANPGLLQRRQWCSVAGGLSTYSRLHRRYEGAVSGLVCELTATLRTESYPKLPRGSSILPTIRFASI